MIWLLHFLASIPSACCAQVLAKARASAERRRKALLVRVNYGTGTIKVEVTPDVTTCTELKALIAHKLNEPPGGVSVLSDTRTNNELPAVSNPHSILKRGPT